MKRNNSLILVFSLIFLSACNIYTANDMIDKVGEVKKINTKNLTKIIELTKHLDVKNYTLYSISTSRTTDGYSFQEYTFDGEKNKFNGFVDIERINLNTIWDNLPNKEITDFIFVKNIYISFRFDHVRDEQMKYAKLIYCFKKDIFKKLFPDYNFYEKNQLVEIKANENWMYFYDNNWALTTSSDMFKMTKGACEKILVF